MNLDTIPDDWRAALSETLASDWFAKLAAFVDAERAAYPGAVFPEEADVFAALSKTPLANVRVVLFGQDPYPTPGHAHGLAFSVKPDVRPIPASLRNVFKELQDDIGAPAPKNGSLIPWTERGVLLLNAALTVRSGEPKSHAGKGWEKFTDAVLKAVASRPEPAVFLLWGKDAQAKAPLLAGANHPVVTAPHPSPLARNPTTNKPMFLGTRPFSRTNDALVAAGQPSIDWTLP